MEWVKTGIEGIKHQRGFTNMAQALVTAEKMFLFNGRKKAQSVVMMITDGKPTLLYETNEKVVDMKDKAVKLFFAPITEAKGKGSGSREEVGKPAMAVSLCACAWFDAAQG